MIGSICFEYYIPFKSIITNQTTNYPLKFLEFFFTKLYSFWHNWRNHFLKKIKVQILEEVIVQSSNYLLVNQPQTLLPLKVHVPCALCFFTYLSIKEHFTLIVGSEGKKIYNNQSFQLRNNGFGIREVGNCKQPHNIIIIILYNVHFLYGTCTFNGSSVLKKLQKPHAPWIYKIVITKHQIFLFGGTFIKFMKIR